MTRDPAELYADRVAPEHRHTMETVAMAYHTLTMVAPHLRELEEAERRAHSVGHIFNPTLYRDMIGSKSFAQQMKIVRAALAFVAAMDAVKAEMMESQ